MLSFLSRSPEFNPSDHGVEGEFFRKNTRNIRLLIQKENNHWWSNGTTKGRLCIKKRV
jgi:hypothetical protein